MEFLRERTKYVKPEAFNSKDKRGLTPLHKAVGLNRKEVAEFLLSAVSDRVGALQCGEYLSRTPLHYAALVTESDRDLYDWLVEAGAEETAEDSDGKTPRDYLEEQSASTKLRGKLMEVPDAPRLGLSGRKSPSKRGFSPVKGRDSSPSKGRRQASKLRKDDKSMSLITPATVSLQQVRCPAASQPQPLTDLTRWRTGPRWGRSARSRRPCTRATAASSPVWERSGMRRPGIL